LISLEAAGAFVDEVRNVIDPIVAINSRVGTATEALAIVCRRSGAGKEKTPTIAAPRIKESPTLILRLTEMKTAPNPRMAPTTSNM